MAIGLALLAFPALARAQSTNGEAPESAVPQPSPVPVANQSPEASPHISASTDVPAAPPADATLPSYETVVTASRTPQLAADAPVATFVIPRSEIVRSGARTVAELLATQPGVQLEQGVGGTTSLTLQGLSSEYVLVLIDGERAIGRTDGTFDLARLMTHDVEAIEIVPGASSALYGADALGGVINIVTRRGQGATSVEAQGRYGSRDNLDVTANADHSLGLANLHLAAGVHHANGYDLDASDQASTGSDFLNYELSARGDLALAERTQLRLRAEYQRRDLEGVDVSDTGAILDRQNLIESFITNARLTQALRLRDKLTLSATYSNYRDQFAYDQRQSTQLDQYQDSREQQGQLTTQYELAWSTRQSTIVGLEGIVQALETNRLSSGKADRQRGAVYLQHIWNVDEQARFSIVPGARFDADSQFGSAVTPKLSLRFAPAAALTLRASYGEGFRAPDFKELYLLFDNPSVGYRVVGNPDLDPERSRSVNVSATYRFDDDFEVTVSGYANFVRNMIVSTSADDAGVDTEFTTIYTYDNVARAHTIGADLQARLHVFRDLWLDAGYGYVDGEDRETGDPLPGLARHRATAQIRHRIRPWDLTTTVRVAWTDERPFYRDRDGDGMTSREMASPYTMVDARVAKTFGSWLDVFVGTQNLANVGDAEDLPIAPRLLYAGAGARY